jgi:nuclear transport factor 2 (NTF2) superfamily protein
MTPQLDDTTIERKAPVPPFSYEDAVKKVRMAEDAWNTRNPDKIKMAYTNDTVWRNRSQFIHGRDEVAAFLTKKFQVEDGYRLIKEIWAHSDNRIAVRFCYEFHDENGQWYRAYGNENWEFNDNGLMKFRHASINDVPIKDEERKFHVSFNFRYNQRNLSLLINCTVFA